MHITCLPYNGLPKFAVGEIWIIETLGVQDPPFGHVTGFSILFIFLYFVNSGKNDELTIVRQL